MPLMDVESSPLVPNVATRFRRIVAHGNGGVLFDISGLDANRAETYVSGRLVAVAQPG